MPTVKEMNDALPRDERHGAMLERQQEFVRIFPTYGTVRHTMNALGLDRTAFYRWLRDPVFNAVWQELKQDRIEEIVNRLYTFVIDNGADKMNQQQILAAFFLLKAFDPKTFSDKMQLQHTGADGAPVKVTTVEIHRADNPDNGRVTKEELAETVESV